MATQSPRDSQQDSVPFAHTNNLLISTLRISFLYFPVSFLHVPLAYLESSHIQSTCINSLSKILLLGKTSVKGIMMQRSRKWSIGWGEMLDWVIRKGFAEEVFKKTWMKAYSSSLTGSLPSPSHHVISRDIMKNLFSLMGVFPFSLVLEN